MQRYAAFDPPEYLDWKPDSEVLRSYRDRLLESEERREIVESLEPDSLLDLYRGPHPKTDKRNDPIYGSRAIAAA